MKKENIKEKEIGLMPYSKTAVLIFLIFLFFAAPPGEWSVVITFFAFYFSALYGAHHLYRTYWLQRKVEKTFTNFRHYVLGDILDKKSSYRIVLNRTQHGGNIKDSTKIIKKVSQEEETFWVEMQIYKQIGDTFCVKDLRDLPKEVSAFVEERLQTLDDTLRSVIIKKNKSLAYSANLLSWIKFMGVLSSIGIAFKLAH